MKKLFPLMLMLCCAICAKATVTIGGKTLAAGTTLNSSSSGYGITYGTIALSSDSKTLTLTNVTMSSTSPCINANSSLTIKLVGTNTLTSTNDAVLKLSNTSSAQTFTITSSNGRGILTATSTSNAALRNEKSNITFSYCDVTLVGKNYSVWTQQTTITEIINVTNAHLTIKNTVGTTATIQQLKELNLTGCTLANGYVFNNGGVMTSASGSYVKGTIEFVPDSYPIKVRGTQITSPIINDILDDGGSVRYNTTFFSSGTGLLELRNANVSCSFASIIEFLSTATRASVWCSGTSTLTTSASGGYSAIYSQVPLRVWCNTGSDAKLTLNNTNTTNGYGIMSKNDVTISDLDLTANAFQCITSLVGGKLNINNANVTATRKSTSGQAICDFTSVSLSDCNVTSPTTVTYDTTNKYYTSKGGKVSSLTISKGADNTKPEVYSVRTTSKSYYTATIAWNMEDNHTAKSKLKMKYTLVKGSTLVENPNLSDGATSVSLSGLEAGTTYTLRVRAQDEAGLYGYSDDYQFTTATITDYKIKIAGTSVTSLNYSNIPVASGTAKYVPSSNRLILTNATINSGNDAAIYSESEGLTIKIIGQCHLNTTNNAPIVTAATTGTTTIIGDSYKSSQLYLTSGTGFLNMNNFDAVEIQNVSIKGNGSIWGSRTKSLSVESSRISLEGSVTGYSSLSMSSDLTMKTPAGGKYASYKLQDANGNTAIGCEIGPQETYSLEVLNTPVTYSNCDDILGDGTAKYDPISNVLTLHNADLATSNDGMCINSCIDGLTIKVEGTNTLKADNTCIFHNADETIIKGDSREDKLIMTSGNISIKGYSLTVKDCTVETYIMYGWDNSNLVVDNANIRAHTIFNYDKVVMKNGVKVLWPTGATYRMSSNGIMRHGIGDQDVYNVFLGIEADDIDYGISVAGTPVKYSNYTDILSSDGSVSYDNATSTLTLKTGFIIVPAGSKAITKTSGDLTIVVEGQVDFISENWEDVIETSGNVIIRGHNRATTADIENDQLYFFHREGGISYGYGQKITFNQSLKVSLCTLKIGGTFVGNSLSKITISKSVVKASNIEGFGQMDMSTEYVDSTPLCSYDPFQKAFYYYNDEKADGVLLRPITLYVNDIGVTHLNAASITSGVSYDFDTKTLSLDNANIWTINSTCDLNIQIANAGYNQIRQLEEIVTNTGIQCDGDLNIYGSGVLLIDGFRRGIYCSGNVSVKDISLQIFGGSYGIRSGNTISIDGAEYISSANTFCMYGQDVLLQRCKVEYPTGVTLSDQSSWANLMKAQYVKILQDRTFSLSIAGIPVTDQNKDDVLGDGGTVTYNPLDGTLHLNNATISSASKRPIEDFENDLQIVLVGENKVQDFEGGAPIASNTSISIWGANTSDYTSNILRVSSNTKWNAASIACGDNMRISNCSVYTDKKINCHHTTGTITIDAAYVESEITDFAELDLNRAYIETDCHYDTALRRFVDNNDTEVGTVIICPTVLSVGGTDVTRLNCTDILGDHTASYDYDTRVLTLRNANIATGKNICSICPLEIKLEGENTLTVDYGTQSAIEMLTAGELIVNGPGSLTFTGGSGYLISKWAQQSEPITIKNCTIKSQDNQIFIANYFSPIVINNSNIDLQPCIPFVGSSLTFADCHSVNQTNEELSTNIGNWHWCADPVKIVADILIGDVNKDGKISVADIPALVKLLTPKNTSYMLIYNVRYDANCDGKVNVDDIKALERRILNK